MTGEEFEKQIKTIGLKKSDVARKLGVDPDTITARCKDKVVPSLYVFALIGISAIEMFEPMNRLNSLLGDVENPQQSDL